MMQQVSQELEDCQVVIFGGTGDLSHNKLLPAFYRLLEQDSLPANFSIVGLGRRNEDQGEYLAAVKESLKEAVDGFQEEIWNRLQDKIYYHKFDLTDKPGYKDLKQKLAAVDKEHGTGGKRMFYLATAPGFFGLIVENLQDCGLVESDYKLWPRLVIEKPFGRDLNSARELNDKITKIFPERNIYRIDHYLGKEMTQNILIIRFANVLFEPIWNNKYVDNVQIVSTETVGVKKRGKYYDRAGALRDMVQNHMLQLLALTAMEPPADMSAEAIRREKVKVLKSLPQFSPEMLEKDVVTGQYTEGTVNGEEVIGYQEEEDIDSDSQTETFMTCKVMPNNLRWSGVPFYIKTGKRLDQKRTEIIVEFKSSFHPSLAADFDLKPDLLRIEIQPEEGVSLQFNAKEPGTEKNVIPVNMNFCQNCRIGINTPEAYEELLTSIMKGDQSMFTHWEEVKYSWKFIDQIARARREADTKVHSYQPGTFGPKAAERLLTRDNRTWWDKEGYYENI
jgi:glucose-6-phosphate 1-dehydrogenase